MIVSPTWCTADVDQVNLRAVKIQLVSLVEQGCWQCQLDSLKS